MIEENHVTFTQPFTPYITMEDIAQIGDLRLPDAHFTW